MDGLELGESVLSSRWRERLMLEEQKVRPWKGHAVVGKDAGVLSGRQ